jgi:predicted aconitase
MRLTNEEKAMLDGSYGPAVAKAMDLLIRYGEAVGAENLLDASSVSAGVITDGKTAPIKGDTDPFDAFFSEFYLDSSEPLKIPRVRANSCTILHEMDSKLWQVQGVSQKIHDVCDYLEDCCNRIGFAPAYTCAPYLVGYVPVKGEHCAWMESSAVPLCNSVFGGRTNTEGIESTGAAMLTGKIPNWGYHLDENRRGHYLVEVEHDVVSGRDWGLMGYYTGWIVQEKIPVYRGIKKLPSLRKLMYCSAAGASSGGVEMFHIIGVTPEAYTAEMAFGNRKPTDSLKFGKNELRNAYDRLQTASDPDVNFVMLGCPHYSLEEIWRISMMLEGKRIADHSNLWIFTPNAIKAMADRAGYTAIIERAGGYIMCDTCPCIAETVPAGTKVFATDSPKQAHHMHSIMKIPAWFGSMEDCVNAALTGKWEGEF